MADIECGTRKLAGNVTSFSAVRLALLERVTSVVGLVRAASGKPPTMSASLRPAAMSLYQRCSFTSASLNGCHRLCALTTAIVSDAHALLQVIVI